MSADPDIPFTPVLPFETLRPAAMRAVTVGARRVLLVHVDGGVRAYDNRCPHRAWPLERGRLEGGVLTCANHGWRFDVATGQGVDPPDCALVAYPCRVDDDGVIGVAVPAP